MGLEIKWTSQTIIIKGLNLQLSCNPDFKVFFFFLSQISKFSSVEIFSRKEKKLTINNSLMEGGKKRKKSK